MNMLVFSMSIIKEQQGSFIIDIFHKKNSTKIMFTPDTKSLVFLEENSISLLLRKNEYQLRKILHNKRKNTFYVGFHLTFALRDEKDMAAFNHPSKIIVLDKRYGNHHSYVVDKGEELIHKIYTDGSFLEKKNTGGFVVLHKNLKGDYQIYTYQSDEKSSSLLELLAAMKGIEILKNEEKIRIITDSRYVRKGLTEWIVNWELNDWYTANGEKVKNIEHWKKFNMLTRNKYIEFEWVKGHSDHFENTVCDLYAKEIAGKSKKA
ncbi:ribonuclease H family protein [Crassaminicella profunda]|uniref:ribonuclease H family protein n=1 Tax=Crassaminicella profunda TaxID=1286698 RepID=UPI001CA6BBDD|nr:ribonuclease H [Crassaminicella profunda]QZY54423.1 ribonuclease HI [Crassaminicella profunda]